MKHLIFSAIVFVVLGLAKSHAVTLTELHGGRNTGSNSRSPDCVSAMHRYCVNYVAGGGSVAGVSQELGNGVFGVACFDAAWYGEVPLSDLRNMHGGCNLGKSQHPDCMAAVHRWCEQTGRGGAGIVQEVGNNVFGVACFNPRSYQGVSLNILTEAHGGCNSIAKSQDSDCVAAMHRWCGNRGIGTGLAQEVGTDEFGVACFDNRWYGDVRVEPPAGGGGGTGGGGGKRPLGAISVRLGFGAGFPGCSFPCQGSGTVTVSSATGGSRSQGYGYSGFCSNTSPACSTAVFMSALPAGSWRIQDSVSGANCEVQVREGQVTTATIRTDVATCQ